MTQNTNQTPTNDTQKKQPFVTKLNSLDEYQSLMKPPRTHNIRSGRVALMPGENVGVHNTDTMEEVLVVLEGTGEARIGGHGKVHGHDSGGDGHSHDADGDHTHDHSDSHKGHHHGYETMQIEGGMITYIPPHTVHDVVNTGEGALKYIFIVGPAE